MFQLRFLIASDRRRAAVRFTHRDYRGKRTCQDDFHPDYQTFICDSYAQFLTLFEYEQKHQARIEIFPLVELFQAETNTRLKITGNETVFLTSHLEAAAKDWEKQHKGLLVKLAPTTLSSSSLPPLDLDNDLGAPPADSLPSYEECEIAVQEGTDTALHRFIENHEPAGPHDREFRKDLEVLVNELREPAKANLEEPQEPAPATTAPTDAPVVQDAAPVVPPVNVDAPVQNSPAATPEASADTPTTETPATAVLPLAQQIAQLVTEKKRTAADLANALGLSREAVLTAAKADPTILTITGGHWISPA